ncbi:MAG: hypothetical protein ACRDQD_04200 [Nocardioidaceae bacterium]
MIARDCVRLGEPCSESEARLLTEAIQRAAERIWELLLEAYERKAWAALRYPNWREWAQKEFGWGQSRVYQLLDQAKVMRALEEASSTYVEIQEATARDIKGHLHEVADSVRDAIAEVQGDGLSEAETAAIVQDVVERERERIKTETRQRLDRLPPDLNNRVMTGAYDLDSAESVTRERDERLDVWADNLREAMRRLARMAGSPIPEALQERFSEPEFAVLTTILNALGRGDYGFLE